MEKVTAKIDGLVGLAPVKAELHTLMAMAQNQRERAEHGLPVQEQSMHLVFEGNPGTGKTTAARLLGQAYHALGLLEKPTVTTVSRADLVAKYKGQSAHLTRDAFKKAKGGVLFVDEAYDLVQGEGDEYGNEALTELMQQAENNRDNTVVIMAGYTEDMNRMLATNPGARSRFPTKVPFPDYSAKEKQQIAMRSFKEGEYVLDADARRELTAAMKRLPSGRGAGNARDVRNLIEATRRTQARRLAGKGASKQQHQQITADDIRAAVASL